MAMDQKTFELFEESDRGSVIVAAALLEDDLYGLIKAVTQKNRLSRRHSDEMFDLNGPASSFSSKCLICYAFGLISKEIFEDLTQIRRLRNKFAHSSHPIDFLSPEIEDQIAAIHCCIAASALFTGTMFKGRGQKQSAEVNPEVKLADWELRSKGFVKYTKAVFCMGIGLLREKISNFRPDATSASDGD